MTSKIMKNMHNVLVTVGDVLFSSNDCDVRVQITEDMYNKRACQVTLYNISKNTENYFFEIGKSVKVAVEWVNRNSAKEIFFDGHVFDSYKIRDREGNVSFTIICDDGGKIAEQVSTVQVPKGSNMLSVVKEMISKAKGVTLGEYPPSLNAPSPNQRAKPYSGQIDHMIQDYLGGVYRVTYENKTIKIFEYNKGYSSVYEVTTDVFDGYPTRYVKTINNEPEDRDSKRKRYNISMLPFSWIKKGNKMIVTDSKQMPNTPHIIDSMSVELSNDTIRANIAVIEVDSTADNSKNNQNVKNSVPK